MSPLSLKTTALALSFLAGATAEPAPQPPYLMVGANTAFISVRWDPSTVDALVPKGIEPVAEYTGGINMYCVPDGYGISPYCAAYTYVSIEGYDSADGSKARYILQGYYGPDAEVTDAVVNYFSLLVTTGTSAQQAVGSSWEGKGGADLNNPNIQIEISPLGGDCPHIAGTLNYIGKAGRGKKQVSVLAIPYVGDFCAATPVSFALEGNGLDEALDTLGVLEMTGAGQIKNAAFTFAEG